VTSISIKGEALDDDRMYRIITNNFVAEGGDGMTMLTKAAVLDRPGVLVRDAMTDYIHWLADNGLLVDAQLDGRVVIVD
jgi:2',3'-cyclic-nucleotide 2'-phosphodiesterase (5'-nucleotidase family)